MVYVLRCLLPNNRNVCINNHSIVACDIIAENLIGTVLLYSSDGDSRVVTYEELSELLDFNYINRLLVVHEKLLRSLLFSITIPDNQEVYDSYSLQLDNSHISPNISIRYIGVVNDIDVGYGVFAQTALPMNEWIGEYVGAVQNINNSSCDDSGSSDAYAFLYPSCDSSYEINALEYGNVIRFVNHSNHPNAEFRRIYSNGLWHIVVFTTRAIEPNDQITVSYGETYWNHKGIIPADI